MVRRPSPVSVARTAPGTSMRLKHTAATAKVKASTAMAQPEPKAATIIPAVAKPRT